MHMHTIDLLGAMLSFISAIFYMKEKPIAWLISLLAIPFDAVMDLNLGIFGDLVLQFIYCGLLLHGWYVWRASDKAEDQLSITRISLTTFLRTSAVSIGIVLLIWYGLNVTFPSDITPLDASVTGLSLMGVYLLSRKILESWLLWIGIDILYVILFSTKDMPLHALMSLFDAVMCVIGYTVWLKEYSGLTVLTRPIAQETAS